MHPIIIGLLIVPVIAVIILVILRKSRSMGRLVPALVLSGAATALTTAFLAFTNATVPIAPYETGRGAWLPVVGVALLALYIGFGIGFIIAALIGVPYQFIANRRQS